MSRGMVLELLFDELDRLVDGAALVLLPPGDELGAPRHSPAWPRLSGSASLAVMLMTSAVESASAVTTVDRLVGRHVRAEPLEGAVDDLRGDDEGRQRHETALVDGLQVEIGAGGRVDDRLLGHRHDARRRLVALGLGQRDDDDDERG